VLPKITDAKTKSSDRRLGNRHWVDTCPPTSRCCYLQRAGKVTIRDRRMPPHCVSASGLRPALGWRIRQRQYLGRAQADA